MPHLTVGLIILATWALLTFVIRPDTGWIHVSLIVGVLLVIRGIVARDETSGG